MSPHWKFEFLIQYCLLCGIHLRIDLGAHQEDLIMLLSTKNHYLGRHKLTSGRGHLTWHHIYAFKTRHKDAIIDMINLMITLIRIPNKAALQKIQIQTIIYLVRELYKWCLLAIDVQSNPLYTDIGMQCWLWESQRALRWEYWAGHTPTRPSCSLPLIKLCNSGQLMMGFP